MTPLPGLVLLHGTGATPAQWDPFLLRLRERFTVLAADYNAPLAANPDADVDEVVRAILDAAQLAGLVHFSVVGHSLGGTLALAVAAAAPERVDRVVAHAPWLRADARMRASFELWDALAQLDDGDLFVREILLSALGPRFWAGANDRVVRATVAMVCASLPAELRAQIALDLRLDISESVADITAPTTIIGTEGDTIVPLSHQRDVQAQVAGSRLVVLEGGHGLPAEAPEDFLAAVLDGLSG